MKDPATVRRRVLIIFTLTFVFFATFLIVHYNWAQPWECTLDTDCVGDFQCVMHYCNCFESNFTDLYQNGMISQSRPWRCDTTETEVKPYGWAQITAYVFLSLGIVLIMVVYVMTFRSCQCTVCPCCVGMEVCTCSYDCECNYDQKSEDQCGCHGCAYLMKHVNVVIHNPSAWLSYKCTCHSACFDGCRCHRGVACKEPRKRTKKEQ